MSNRFTYWVGGLLYKTPFFQIAESGYRCYRRNVIERFVIPVALYRRTESRSPRGFFEIFPPHFDPFHFWIDGRSGLHLQLLDGTYEQEVLETLAEHADSETVFWEVGARWGYFSLALSSTVDSVVAFRSDEEQIRVINKNIDRNSTDNVTVVQGEVGKTVDLNEYEPPDLIVMDIEGWEYEVLNNSEQLLDLSATWIVEVHGQSAGHNASPNFRPEQVVDIFKEHGYRVDTLGRQHGDSYHIVADRGASA